MSVCKTRKCLKCSTLKGEKKQRVQAEKKSKKYRKRREGDLREAETGPRFIPCRRRKDVFVELFMGSCFDNPQHENIYELSEVRTKKGP